MGMKSVLRSVLLMCATVMAQQGPGDIPESIEGLKAMRLDLTSEFSALQRELRQALTQAERDKMQMKLREFARRVKLFRGAEKSSTYSTASYGTVTIPAHGVVGTVLKRHSSSSSGDIPDARLSKALVELKELPLPEYASISDKEVNQIQKVLDKSYEVINLATKSK